MDYKAGDLAKLFGLAPQVVDTKNIEQNAVITKPVCGGKNAKKKQQRKQKQKQKQEDNVEDKDSEGEGLVKKSKGNHVSKQKQDMQKKQAKKKGVLFHFFCFYLIFWSCI